MKNIVSSFHEIVKRMPDRTAVIYEGENWTYRELDEQSDRIAAFLKSHQLKGKQVGIAMERGQQWIVALLGLWKAGAVYVPLDLNHPPERLETIMADCEVAFVIYSRGGDFKLEEIPCCCMDRIRVDDYLSDQSFLPNENDRAYILYTSGTSGEPKGIPSSHQQAVRMSRISKDRCFYVNAGDKMLQLASLNFSASLGEALTGLLNGVCLVIAGGRERQDPRLLIKLIEAEKVCSALIPPALLSVFPKVPLKELKTLVVGGEGVTVDAKNFWMKGRRMVNAYGFTENTALVTTGVYEKDAPINDVGTVVPDSVVYILDENLRPVPDGTPGELYVGGIQLTEGYWKRPELNLQKFIGNPFLTEDERREGRNLRLYKSGDKVMRLPNGHYLCLGRLDNQVKIRGMRIELSEIERCLNQYPGVSMSVVVVKESVGRKVLVAYLQTDKEIDRDEMTAFVAGKLPDYMRPVHYIRLHDFPLTINRKINKSQLPEPDWKAFEEQKELPFTPVEKEIARIWSKILGMSGIGRSDHFISLGGDSISVFLLTNALEEAFGIALKVEDVFSRLNLCRLAQFVESSMQKKEENKERIFSKNEAGVSLLPPSLRNLWSQCISSSEMNESYKLAVFLPWNDDLKVDALQKAWNRVVREQEAMRMFFPLDEHGKPYIEVSPFTYSEFPVREVEKDAFREVAYQLYVQPFFPAIGPLHRVCFYRFPEGEYILMIIIHHLVTDGWSLRLLNEMLRDYYLQAMNGRYFYKQSYSYRDYAAWCKRQLDGITVKKRKLFWKKYLSGCSPLFFEGKRNKRELPQKQGSIKYIPMNVELAEQLESFCELHAVTPLVTCLSVFQLILAKHTGRRDFVIGLAATNRKRLEFQNLLGYFVSLLPVRIMDGDGNFEWYTKELMGKVVSLLSWSLPLDMILETLEEYPGQKKSRLIRFAFGMEGSPSNVNIPEEWVTYSPFDMSLIIHKHEGIYSFHFHYATACFDGGFIEQFCESFQVAMRFLLNDSSYSNVWTCPLLSEMEVTKRITPFDFSGLVFPKWNVAQRLMKIATAYPRQEAYCWADFRMTYGELDEASNRVAAAIEAKFTCMEKKQEKVPVGIYLKEKKYLLPAIMGVLKYGSCYVPLDKSLPTERIKFIVKDAAVSLLLVDETLPSGIECEMLFVKTSVENSFPVSYDISKTVSNDTAYIIYTSGTTGKPKGIPISHGSLAWFAESQVEIYRLLPDKRILQYASVGFDASVMEIFPALLTGATVVIPTEEERKDPNRLLDLMEREKVYCSLIPPALLAVLPYRALPDLKTLVVGGEGTPVEVIEKWRQGRRFINEYGPTENSVATTWREFSEDFLFNDIGFPLPGVACYVLDTTMTLLPDYVPGELYIGGLQLTGGYINREDLNREKFVENPFVSVEDKKLDRNMRLYKSGDRVMRTSEGTFLFLGRIDSQVKVRGFRIELEEIARHLERYPGIVQAIVLLKEYKDEKRIVAYLLAEEKVELNIDKIRQYLSKYLPSYMIPSAWSVLRNLPRTVNGKIDREALPEPEALITEDYEPPLTPEEETFSEIVAQLLQVSKVGVYTDLFDRGLTSLQTMELVHYAQKEKLSVSIPDIYEGKCIRNILVRHEKRLFYWEKSADDRKPLIILVCGYSYSTSFYGRFIECLKNDYSFFVFESFLEYFEPKDRCHAGELVDYYSEVIKREMGNKDIHAVVGHCLGGELGLLLAEKLRIGGYPSIKALVIDSFIRRDKTLLIPVAKDNATLQKQVRITNSLIKSMPTLAFNGKIFVYLVTKCPSKFIFGIDYYKENEMVRKMWAACLKNKEEWRNLYPQARFYELDTDHWGVFDEAPLAVLHDTIEKEIEL